MVNIKRFIFTKDIEHHTLISELLNHYENELITVKNTFIKFSIKDYQKFEEAVTDSRDKFRADLAIAFVKTPLIEATVGNIAKHKEGLNDTFKKRAYVIFDSIFPIPNQD